MGMIEAWDSMTWGPTRERVSAWTKGTLSLDKWVEHQERTAKEFGENFLHLGGGVYITSNSRPSATGKTYYQLRAASAKEVLYFGADPEEAKKAVVGVQRLPAGSRVQVIAHVVEKIWDAETPCPQDIKVDVNLDWVHESKWLEACGNAGREQLNLL